MTDASDREILLCLAETLDVAATCDRLRISRSRLKQCLERAAGNPPPEVPPPLEPLESVTVNIDGAARGNPGPAGAGVVIWRGNKVFEEFCEYLGKATNNQAEYRALVLALRRARELGARKVAVRSDSELLVKQLLGEYRVKNPELKVLFQQVQDLKRGFKNFTIQHVPREDNREADRLANRAIDEFAEG
jgi:ribonuclease HI